VEQGDLIYIPQSVNLFSVRRTYYDVTKKPRIGIFIRKNDDTHSSVFTRGTELCVETKHIYPMREEDVN
jgi:hypothetical protein